MVDLDAVRPELDRELRLDAEEVAPLERPVVDVLVALEEGVDQPGALVLLSVVEEAVDLRRIGEHTEDVDVDPPEEDLVRAGIRRLDALFYERRENARVDGPAGNEARAVLVRREERRPVLGGGG